MPQSFETSFLNAAWLINLRWVAVFGQIAAIGGAVFLFQTKLPALWALIVVISVTAISNVLLASWFARSAHFEPYSKSSIASTTPGMPQWRTLLGLVMVMDVLSLTALLFATGGPNNPFLLFMLVNVSLGALVLDRKWAWGINVLANVCLLLIAYEHMDLAQLDMGLPAFRRGGRMTLNHLSLLVAFATCSSVIVYFLTRLTGEVRVQQATVRRVQQQQARNEKIEALGTLAAGTAHELATPLSTIAIVAKDVEQAFEKYPPNFPGAADVIEDVHLIRSQLDRCRTIIDRMSSHAGEAVGEPLRQVTVGTLADAALDGLMGRGRVHLKLSATDRADVVSVPIDGLSQAIRGLVQNALDADDSDRPVTVKIQKKGNRWDWEITDQGTGMSAAILERVSEPFFTTKSPGKGMGLGVFLAKNVVNRLGGSVKHKSTQGQGTTVNIDLPSS